MFKRLFDIAISAAGLLVLLPLLVVIAGAVRVFLGAPIFFRQARPGLQGRPFTVLKFRTMRHALSADGRPLPDEQRLTGFGQFLRASSLDELPELWNVLRGDMSLVGPRPLLMEYLPLYSVEQARRHEVRPGITGWAQIKGRNAVDWNERLRLDVWYVDHRSFWLDLRILWQTLWAVLSQHGIAASGHVTMPRFTGANEGRE